MSQALIRTGSGSNKLLLCEEVLGMIPGGLDAVSLKD